MSYLALTAAAFVTIVRCLGQICRLWSLTSWRHRIALFVTMAVVAEINYVLWFTLNPLEESLANMLTKKADSIMHLDEPIRAVQLAVLSAIWLIALTSGFIVAKDGSELREVHKQLDQLTVLLYLAAVVVVLFMFVLAAATFSAASLLGEGKESARALIRQLALVESLNFGVFWSVF